MEAFDLEPRMLMPPLESRKVKTVDAIHAKRAKKRNAVAACDSRHLPSELRVILFDLR
jgi:hypothetical protein